VLGLGDQNVFREYQTFIPNLGNISGISTGRDHTIVLNNNGNVYSFGRNAVIFFIIK
jgi:alpha-tubulin suppressor-like RCC1 family protein